MLNHQAASSRARTDAGDMPRALAEQVMHANRKELPEIPLDARLGIQCSIENYLHDRPELATGNYYRIDKFFGRCIVSMHPSRFLKDFSFAAGAVSLNFGSG
jgi:hypothetical protein